MAEQGGRRAWSLAGKSAAAGHANGVPLHAVRWVGVLSDTHGDVATTARAAEEFHGRDVQLVVHCGDIGSAEIPALLAGWPAHFVLGNVDGNSPRLRAAIAAQAGQVLHGRCGMLTVGNRRIAWLHGDDAARFRALVHCRDWDVVCYGHTHRAECRVVDGTLVVNPGAIHRGYPPSVAVIDLARLEVHAIPLGET
jgi:putative phosphoesterase